MLTDTSPYLQECKTSLMLAIANQHESAALLLITPTATAGALDVRDKTGYTALMLAVDKGLVHDVELLITAGAKPEVTDTGGMTALALACVMLSNDFPPTLVLSGKSKHQHECLGMYSRVERKANGRPVWKHASFDRWIAKGSDAYWRVQEEKDVGVRNAGWMQLKDPTAGTMLPHQSSGVWWVDDGTTWIEVPALTCEGPSEVNS